MKFRDIEKLVLNAGWYYIGSGGSHHQYLHPTLPGKVTIAKHSKDVSKIEVGAILRQSGINPPKG
jgi:predicted RNA binding protein YcfA (HicA-like mRNA interferase family)